MPIIQKLNVNETQELIIKFISEINYSYLITHFEFFKNPDNWFEFSYFFEKKNIEIVNIHLPIFKNNFNNILNHLLTADLIKIYKQEYEKHKNKTDYNPYTFSSFPFSVLNNTALNRMDFCHKYILDRELMRIEFSLYYQYEGNAIHTEANLFVDIGDKVVKKHHFAKPLIKSLNFKQGKFLINKENISDIMKNIFLDMACRNVTNEDLKIYINNQSKKNCSSDFLLENCKNQKTLIRNAAHYNDSSIVKTENERILIDLEWVYMSCLYDDIKNTYEDIVYYDSPENKSLYFTVLLYEPPYFIHNLKSYKIVLKDQNLKLYNCDLKKEMKWITKKEKNILSIKNIFDSHNVRENVFKTIERDIENELNKKIIKKMIKERKDKLETDLYNFFEGLDIKLTFLPFESMSLFEKCNINCHISIVSGENSLNKLFEKIFFEHEEDQDLRIFREKALIHSRLAIPERKSLKNIKRL